MVLCECACANHILKANFNLINRTDVFICFHKMFQISFQNSKGQKRFRKFLGIRSELLPSIYIYVKILNSTSDESHHEKTCVMLTNLRSLISTSLQPTEYNT